MRFLSLFSGIEAASEAWCSLGWTCVAFSEIEPFPNRVLAHHHPEVPNLGNVNDITEAQIKALGRIDVVIFGSPCQDLSIAGNRKGFQDGTRSSLFFIAMRIVGWSGCRFALWENVPGAFSSNAGADFAAVVGAMGGGTIERPPNGWGNEGAYVGSQAMVEWSTLDAQWFGVAQRRRRLFALADFGNWFDRPPILLEPEGLRGHSAPSRGTGQDAARAVATGSRERSHIPVSSTGDIAHCLNAGGMGRIDYETETMIVYGFNAEAQMEEMRFDPHTAAAALTVGQRSAVCYMPARTFGADGGINEHFGEREIADALHTGSGNKAPIVVNAGVRRLTPRECERLQGFADDHTAVGGAANGPRYKALGNSMAVPVIRWIGHSIENAMVWS